MLYNPRGACAGSSQQPRKVVLLPISPMWKAQRDKSLGQVPEEDQSGPRSSDTWVQLNTIYLCLCVSLPSTPPLLHRLRPHVIIYKKEHQARTLCTKTLTDGGHCAKQLGGSLVRGEQEGSQFTNVYSLPKSFKTLFAAHIYNIQSPLSP